MKPLKASKSNRRKSVVNKPIKNLRDYFQSQGIKYYKKQCQVPTTKSSDENLMSVFRIMWNTNMLLKNVLNKNGAITDNKDFIKSVYEKSTIENIYKIIWKSKYVMCASYIIH